MPEKRVDKNGRLVTKHVKLDTDTGFKRLLASIPAPSLGIGKRSVNELSNEELVDSIGRSLSKAGFSLTYDHLELIEGTKVKEPSRSMLEALCEATEGIDTQGAKSLMSGCGIYRYKIHDHNSACLEIAARAYRFSREVDDATPVSDHDGDQFHFYGQIGSFVKDFLNSNVNDGSDPGDVADIEGAYLMDRLDIENSSFNTLGAFYRGMAKLKDRREDITPYLPLLITARMVDIEQNTTLNDIFDLTDYLKNICPPEKVRAVSAEIFSRRIFNVETVEELARIESTPMINGVL